MLSLFLMTLSIQVTGASPKFECHYAPKNSEIGILKGKNFKIEIPIQSKSSKMLKCQKFPGFDNLIAAEIDLGVTGTTASAREIHLMIYEILKGSPRELFDREIGTEVIYFSADGKKNETKTQIPYELSKDKTGAATVLWSSSRIPIVLKPH